MSADILPFPASATVGASVLAFPRPLGGARVTRHLNAVLNSTWRAYGGWDADLAVIDDLAAAVSDPTWDDGDAPGIADQVSVAVEWLERAVSDQWARTLADDGCWCLPSGSDAIERATSLTGAAEALTAVRDTLAARSGPGAPVFDPRLAALGLMDIDLYADIE